METTAVLKECIQDQLSLVFGHASPVRGKRKQAISGTMLLPSSATNFASPSAWAQHALTYNSLEEMLDERRMAGAKGSSQVLSKEEEATMRQF